jgi:hypothetical protein
MKKNIFVTRCGPYDDSSLGGDLYESFEKMARGGDNLKLKPNAEAVFKAKFPSEFKKCGLAVSALELRCVQTAKMISKNKLVTLPELGEISFSMKEIISKQDFFKGGMPQVELARKLFVNKLMAGEITESLQSIISRVESVLNFIEKEKSEKIVLVSHSFFMKVMETYIKDPQIEKKPKRIKNYFTGREKFYDYFGGFRFSMYNLGKERKIEI